MKHWLAPKVSENINMLVIIVRNKETKVLSTAACKIIK